MAVSTASDKEPSVTNNLHKKITLFWSFRSPYSYLVLPRLQALSESTGVSIDVRVVHPNILRNPNYFKTMNPLARPYFMRDTQRTAAFLGMPFRRPVPDPIQQNPETLDVAAEQPLARWLGHLGIAATEAGRGFSFCLEVSRLLWDGSVDQWHEGDHLQDACGRAGLQLSELSTQVTASPDYYEKQLQVNADCLTAAGHWGVPTMVYEGETFFGQDRIDVLAWCIKQRLAKSG
jgi:2-hydroxychromene-2-carboxylate isomerase